MIRSRKGASRASESRVLPVTRSIGGCSGRRVRAVPARYSVFGDRDGVVPSLGLEAARVAMPGSGL